MLGIASVLLYGFHHFSSYHIYLATLLLGIGFYLFVFFCLTLNLQMISHWFWYALKMSGFFLFTVLMTCYWTFIDQYHHLQDAKRLYSLFSSSIFLGAATTGLLMRSGLLELDHLILLIIGVLAITLLWIYKISQYVPLVVHEEVEHKGQAIEQGRSFRFLIQSILASPFTLLLMASNFLIYLLLVITEYNYMFTFQNYFSLNHHPFNIEESTEANLTLFLGQWLATVSVINLVFGLFVYSRLVRSLGIGHLLVITPLLLIMAFGGWLVNPSLLFPLIGFFVVEGTLYVVDDNNFNLLLNAVPSKLKYKIRVMIESFFEPIGMLTSALLLSLFQEQSKLLGLILAFLLLAIAFGLRSRYLKALFFNLSENAIHFQRTTKEWINQMSDKQQRLSESRLLSILKLGDEQAQLFACEGLLAFEDPTILKRLLNYASQMTSSAKLQLIHLFKDHLFAKDPSLLDALQKWLQHHPDPQLKSTILSYLAKQGLLHPDKVIEDLNSPDIHLQGAAIVALKKSLAYLPPTIAAQNRTLALQHLQLLLDSKEEEPLRMGLQLLGIEGDSHEIEILLSYLRHPSLAIARQAARSLAQIGIKDTIRQAPLVIAQLDQINDHEERMSCLQALEAIDDSGLVDDLIRVSLHFRPNERRLIEEIIYKMGLRTVPMLLSILRDTQIPDRSRLLAGRILGRLALPQLRTNLSDIIRQEIDRAHFYFYHAHTIQSTYPALDLHLLRDVLMTDYHSVLDFMIQLLGVAGEVENEELLSRSLRSQNPKVRSQVVETLEKTCEPAIFRLLQPLVDEIPYEEKRRAYLKSGHQPLPLTAILDKMSESPAQMDQILAAMMKYHLNLPNWRESLRQQMSCQDELFHHFAYELLET